MLIAVSEFVKQEVRDQYSIIDVRGKARYDQGHIPLAVVVEADEATGRATSVTRISYGEPDLMRLGGTT